MARADSGRGTMGEQVASMIIYAFVAVAALLAVVDILYRRRD
jgi:hypothetical protein